MSRALVPSTSGATVSGSRGSLAGLVDENVALLREVFGPAFGEAYAQRRAPRRSPEASLREEWERAREWERERREHEVSKEAERARLSGLESEMGAMRTRLRERIAQNVELENGLGQCRKSAEFFRAQCDRLQEHRVDMRGGAPAAGPGAESDGDAGFAVDVDSLRRDVDALAERLRVLNDENKGKTAKLRAFERDLERSFEPRRGAEDREAWLRGILKHAGLDAASGKARSSGSASASAASASGASGARGASAFLLDAAQSADEMARLRTALDGVGRRLIITESARAASLCQAEHLNVRLKKANDDRRGAVERLMRLRENYCTPVGLEAAIFEENPIAKRATRGGGGGARGEKHARRAGAGAGAGPKRTAPATALEEIDAALSRDARIDLPPPIPPPPMPLPPKREAPQAKEPPLSPEGVDDQSAGEGSGVRVGVDVGEAEGKAGAAGSEAKEGADAAPGPRTATPVPTLSRLSATPGAPGIPPLPPKAPSSEGALAGPTAPAVATPAVAFVSAASQTPRSDGSETDRSRGGKASSSRKKKRRTPRASRDEVGMTYEQIQHRLFEIRKRKALAIQSFSEEEAHALAQEAIEEEDLERQLRRIERRRNRKLLLT